jgi:hypothetical protein
MATVMSLYLCAATIGWWIRGYLVSDSLNREEQIAGRFRRLGLESCRGSVQVYFQESRAYTWSSEDFAAVTRWEWGESQTSPHGWSTLPRKLGFGCEYGSNATVEEAWVQSPWWPFTTILGVLPAIWLRSRLRRTRAGQRERRGRCRSCGYSLTGNVSGVCPECGTPIPAKK